MDQCMVLNADYQFINFISIQKAFRLISKGKVEVLKSSDNFIHSFSESFKIPLVLRLIKLARLIFKNKVTFSKRGVFVRDDFKCQYCGKTVHKPELEHVYPQSKGGLTTWENCVCSCSDCNRKKKDFLCSEIKMYPKRKPVAPTITEFFQKKFLTLGFDKIMEELFT